ncbi:MAG: type II secretion system protein GspM [Syntrophales bacterium]|nr:type II secretion system protein GspM [Syntrophales bacterium]
MNRIKDFWTKLGKRERYALGAGLAVIILFFAVNSALIPLIEAGGKLQRSIRSSEKTLKEITALSSEFEGYKKDLELVRSALASRSPGFSLYSFIEQKAGEAGVRSNIKSMRPGRSPLSAEVEESVLEMGMDKITLNQLVRFLHAADSAPDAVRFRKVSVRRSAEDPRYLSAQFQIATYQKIRSETASPGRTS